MGLLSIGCPGSPHKGVLLARVSCDLPGHSIDKLNRIVVYLYHQMIEALAHLGFGYRRQEPSTQRFDAIYYDISTEQLRSSNYPDNDFSGYFVYLTDQSDIGYLLDISKCGRWRTTRTEIPQVCLAIIGNVPVERCPAEVQLSKFAETMTTLCEVLRSKGRLEWVLKAESRVIMDANIIIHHQDGKPQAFSTKGEVADFVDALLPYGLTLIGGRGAYFTGLSMQEVLACNFPRSTWPENLFEQNTSKQVLISGLTTPSVTQDPQK